MLIFKLSLMSSIVRVQMSLSADVIVTNVSGRLSSLRPRLRSFLRDMYRHGTPASHVFVLMISSEQRRVKPYAIPIQCLPYTSMDNTTMRRIVCNALQLMLDRGMKIAG